MECLAVFKKHNGDVDVDSLGVSASISEATRDWELSLHGVLLLSVLRSMYLREIAQVLVHNSYQSGYLIVAMRDDGICFVEPLYSDQEMLSATRYWVLEQCVEKISLIAVLRAEYCQAVVDALSRQMNV